MVPSNRVPTHPGKVLLEVYLGPLGITQAELAKRMGVPIQRVNTLIAGKRSVSPETALLLSKTLGTFPQFWMNLQSAFDLYEAAKRLDRSRGKKRKV